MRMMKEYSPEREIGTRMWNILDGGTRS
ncbi:hypothetical protein A2U01_0052730, partial [Trifolium medium]|nr:hypothetical protein [Trifolium medium]